jgi:hypothetical protein
LTPFELPVKVDGSIDIELPQQSTSQLQLQAVLVEGTAGHKSVCEEEKRRKIQLAK